jgi:hypothetical protein
VKSSAHMLHDPVAVILTESSSGISFAQTGHSDMPNYRTFPRVWTTVAILPGTEGVLFAAGKKTPFPRLRSPIESGFLRGERVFDLGSPKPRLHKQV